MKTGIMKNGILYLFLPAIVLFLPQKAHLQPNYTANDSVTVYDGTFLPGVNLGYYPGFSDEELATLAGGSSSLGFAGVGARSLRPSLPEFYLEQYGYDFEIQSFAHYQNIGMKEHTVIIGFPSEEHRDTTSYCSDGTQSTLFKNLDAPIWDNGENGTPVNDTNYYALYLWRMVNLYKPYVKFWEIWNEPGFDYTFNTGYLLPGDPGNWWDNDPNPCDYKLHAPIQQYVRILRISWEVIKEIDPSAQVCVSGTGYPSFLDAILRNTDNPNSGLVTSAYPLGGGAYFDCIGFHSYPHFDGALREWNQATSSWTYYRHSDAAMRGFMRSRDDMQEVLDDYGYNGSLHPEKNWVITECNIPRKQFGEFIGSSEAQKNFIIKAWVECARRDFKTLHIYKIAEESEYNLANFEFETMGLYKKLNVNNGFNQIPNEQGIAYETATTLLYGWHYDPIQSTALNLPNNIDGVAFVNDYGEHSYVLWAKTQIDQSEVATAVYSFPSNIISDSLLLRTWDFAYNTQTSKTAPTNIVLSATPIFLQTIGLSVSHLQGCTPLNSTFSAPSQTGTWHWTFEGGVPSTAVGNNITVTFEDPGIHHVVATRVNASNDTIQQLSSIVTVETAPTANYDLVINGPIIQTSNLSSLNASSFIWQFGDGLQSTEAVPQHLFDESGIYTISLSAINECGVGVATQNWPINAPTPTSGINTALDSIASPTHTFISGARMNYYPGWNDENLANLLAGNEAIEVKGLQAQTLRTLLPAQFLDYWGYDIRVPTFQHFANLQIHDNTATLGFPAPYQIENINFCPIKQNQLFRDLYTNIWDNGENGTAINEANIFATYVFKTVQQYKDNITYWEVLSAPGYDPEGDNAWKPSGETGNWWDSNPDPCDYALHAPVQHYIRMLRIAYEVIHALDTNAYVTLTGIGEPSFLDVILRNTDNPLDGSVNAAYPYKGGAWFDAIGITNFPHLDGTTQYYDLSIGDFVFARHSDGAAKSIVNQLNKYKNVLQNYGFGQTLPQKVWVSSAANVPSVAIDDFIGGQDVQRNFVMKGRVIAEKNGLQNWLVDQLAETADSSDATDPSGHMGLYKKLPSTLDYQNAMPTKAGIGLATLSKVLLGCKYDPIRTQMLNLPNTVDGAAFLSNLGEYHYVLWAKTNVDQSEDAFATYSFNPSIESDSLVRRMWDFYDNGFTAKVAPNNIFLTGTPMIFSENAALLALPGTNFTQNVNTGCAGLTVQYQLQSTNVDSVFWHFPGGTPSTSTSFNPNITYNTSGLHDTEITTFNAAGSAVFIKTEAVFINNPVSPGFTFEVGENGEVTFSESAQIPGYDYLWVYGDGNSEYALSPSHTYEANGLYQVLLILSNECGFDTSSAILNINASPVANISYATPGCAPSNIQFYGDQSQGAATYSWFFSGGLPQNSGDVNPLVTYNQGGSFYYRLTVTNAFGTDTLEGNLTVGAAAYLEITPSLCANETYCYEGGSICFDVNDPMPSIFTISNAGVCDTTVWLNIQWLSGDTTLLTDSVQMGNTYSYNNTLLSAPGSYTFNFTNILGCDSLIQLTLTSFDTTSATVNIDPESGISVYPNPFVEQLTFSDLDIGAYYEVQLTDMLGRALFLGQVRSDASGKAQIMTPKDVSAGVYSIALFQNGASVGQWPLVKHE